jgi:hypothetical protein
MMRQLLVESDQVHSLPGVDQAPHAPEDSLMGFKRKVLRADRRRHLGIVMRILQN